MLDLLVDLKAVWRTEYLAFLPHRVVALFRLAGLRRYDNRKFRTLILHMMWLSRKKSPFNYTFLRRVEDFG